jgi:hypothetical protein
MYTPPLGAWSQALSWYTSLLQLRAAQHFKSSVPQPKGLQSADTYTSRLTWLSVTAVLDAMQSWGAPLIAIPAWAMMYTGVYTRGWCMCFLIAIQALCGLRAFTALVFTRLATLKSIGKIVRRTEGSRDERIRRRRFMINKWVALVIEIAGVFVLSVFTPTSLLVLGSTFNSWKMAVNMTVVYGLVVISATISNIHVYFIMKKRKRKHLARSKMLETLQQRGENVTSSASPSNFQSLPSGMSVVDQN